MSRRAAKVDSNHPAVVDALRAFGCSVQSLAEIGNGCPDLLCGVNGHNFLLEVKDGSLVPSARLLTPDQKRWHTDWRGRVHLAETIEQALAIAAHYCKRKDADA